MSVLSGKTAVVTGANSGVGRSAAELICSAGAHVIMVCRSRARGERARDEILRSQKDARLELEVADLVDMAQVRSLGERLSSRLERVDMLINNAGVWRQSRETSPDGFEVSFATNHLSHFLLTHLLLAPLLERQGRVINVSSEAHRRGDFRRSSIDSIVRGEAWKNGIQAYGDSKLANVLFSRGLVQRHGSKGLMSAAVHPGVLATRIWNQNSGPLSWLMRAAKPLLAKASVGGQAVARLATHPRPEEVNGLYFKIEEEVEPSAQAQDGDLANQLWEKSAEWTGLET